MSLYLQALGKVQGLEAELRDALRDALEAREYDDVARIASLASGLAALTRVEERAPPVEKPQEREAAEDGGGDDVVDIRPPRAETERSMVEPTRPRKSVITFPRFEREGERIIKVGWSTKDKREYEHRAPRMVPELLLDRLIAIAKKKKVFAMEQALPLRDGDGKDLPSYQAYLALAWLREAGLVLKKGKNGYSLSKWATEVGVFDRIWQNLPERG